MLRIVIYIITALSLFGCATIQAIEDVNITPENLLRGDPLNTNRVQNYLQSILSSPNGYKVKAYHRRAFSPENKKTALMIHYFYVYYKDGNMEHTLVFTGTPRDSEHNAAWMLDASTDVESYNLYRNSDNPWKVVEFTGPNGEALDLVKTTQKILDRIEKKYSFFTASNIRNMSPRNTLYLILFPPPFITYGLFLLAAKNKDSCSSAVVETVAWAR